MLRSPRSALLLLGLVLGCRGADGAPGTSCSATRGGDGSVTVSCTDGTRVTLPAPKDGEPGPPGPSGIDGTSCRLEDRPDGSRVVVCPDGSEAVLSGGRRRHVILFIGDGMQLAHEISGSRYLYGRDDGLSFHSFPARTFVTTWDVTTYDTRASLEALPRYTALTFDPRVGFDPSRGGDKPYPLLNLPALDGYFFPKDGQGNVVHLATDSASAATAMSTGIKTDNGNLAWAPGDGEQGALRTSMQQLREERGFSIGVVTTVPFSHATPAAFVAHSVDRGAYLGLAEEILGKTQPEVVIGGGHPWFVAGTGEPAFTYVSESRYQAVKHQPGLVFVERVAGADGGPALLAAADLAAQGGQRLFGLFGGAGGSFEAGTPAHAPGSPAIASVTRENPTLAEAAIAALRVLSRDPDGLFLVAEQGDIDWASHANDFPHLVASVADLDAAVRAVVAYVDEPGDALDWSNTTLLVTADHANGYLRFGPAPLGKGELPQAPVTDRITWGSAGHTNELVSFYAKGSGRDLFWRYANVYAGKPLIDNTAIHSIVLAAARGEE